MAYILASKSPQSKAYRAKIPVSSQLNISVWRHYLTDYVDHVVVDFLQFGWPINYTSRVLPQPTHTNHQSALSYPEDVQHYLSTELSFGALAGPFKENPLRDDLITSPLQTVYKHGSTKRRVVMGLSFPHAASVNTGIPETHYLDNAFQLRLPSRDRLREFIISKGSDLKRVYRQFPIDPKDYKYLGFMWDGLLYFDTRFPFGLHLSALVCQRTTREVIHVFTKEGYTANVYFDDFYGAEHPADSHFAFAHLQDLFDELGLQSSPEKDCHPSTRMICLGILVDTEKMLFEVLGDRLSDLETELLQWTQFSTLTRHQFQSLLGKLSFVTAYVRPGRIFMSRLLNRLRSLPYKQSRFPVTSDMLSDIDWWLSFLPHFNGSAMIASCPSDFHDVLFTCDSSLHRGGATFFAECTSFTFPRDIEELALHINALELFVLIMAFKIGPLSWQVQDSRFRVTTMRPSRLCSQVVHVMPSCSVA